MEELNFKPYKSKKSFRNNYKLHDLAEEAGKNLLVQWGINFTEFGKDKRYEKVWESGNDKPDLIIEMGTKDVFLDWKAKSKPKWLMNKRAADAYCKWSKSKNRQVVIVFLVFDELKILIERRFALLNFHKYIESPSEQWDKNKTIEFVDELPVFNKANLYNLLG